MIEKENILYLLKETLSSLSNNDFLKLKNLSNRTVHSSSIDQDGSSILVAVILYSLSKILERDFYKEDPAWDVFYKKVLKYLSEAIVFLENDDIKNFRRSLKLIRANIDKLSGNLKIYISDVFRKAEINKASKIYEHGISMEKTAKLLGISLWELANYSGQKLVFEKNNESKTVDIKSRIKLVKKFFE